MSDSIEMKNILDKIEVEKEILSAMPKNNKRNIEKYLEKILELIKEYEEYEEKIKRIFEKRYEKSTDIQESKEIENLIIRLNTIENTLYLLSDEKTSYERMELDKIIYKIGRYYKENLQNINQQIEEVIKKFKQVEIELNLSDFDYSLYVEQYMKVFFEEREKGNINSSRLKETFEEIYWKCPDLIIHIELNIRNLYFSNESQIDKFYKKERNELFKKWQKTPEQVMNLYLEIKKQKMEKVEQDKKILVDKFLNNQLNIKDYTQDKMQANYSRILTPIKLESGQEDVEKEIFEFLNSLYEYKNYLHFKFIIDDLKKHYLQRENYKKIYEDTKKKIDTDEKMLNKKLSKNSIFKIKKKDIKQTAEHNQMILDIKKTYKELDLNKFYSKIYSNLKENPSIYEVLCLANSYYNYLTTCIIKNDKTIVQEKIDEEIEKLNEFLKNPYNNIINNLTITEEKDIALIIKDRYKLLSFNIEKEDFTENSIDEMITILENIMISINMNRAELTVEDIEEIIALRDILK